MRRTHAIKNKIEVSVFHHKSTQHNMTVQIATAQEDNTGIQLCAY